MLLKQVKHLFGLCWKWIRIVVRPHHVSHLDTHNPKAPNIDPVVVVFFCAELWSHVQNSAPLIFYGGLFGGQIYRETEISQLDLTFIIVQDVVGFDVSVDNFALVEEVERVDIPVADI